VRIHRYAVLAVLASAASSIATAVVVTSVMPAGATDTTNFGVQQVSGVYFSVDPGTQESGIVDCPKHELATGGGYAIKGSVGIEGPSVTTSERLTGSSTDYWDIHVFNPKLGQDILARAVVECIVPEG
jgi:hypothetical protein